MAATDFAKSLYSAFSSEKPHSSVTQWVDILTSDKYGGEAYDGIPELIDAIKLQSTGPSEASRAIRKKLKHGDTHQQYRALVILKALVENCGPRFQSSFADSMLTDALKHLATDSTADPLVKKKTLQVLASWHEQFKGDPGMSYVAGLYNTVKPAAPKPIARSADSPRASSDGAYWQDRSKREAEDETKRREEKAARKAAEEEAKRKAKEDKEKERLEKLRKEEEARKSKNKPKRKPFIFEQEKPKILASIAESSQASSNLVNAITRVNTANDSLTTNAEVQDCLNKAKAIRKQVVRYVQLVENEELIGTLIETNERIIAAIEMYDTLSKPGVTEKDVEDVKDGLARAKIHDSEIDKLQQKQRAAVQRAVVRSNSNQGIRSPSTSRNERSSRPSGYPEGGRSELPGGVHDDLRDLSFSENSRLQAPMRPSRADEDSGDERVDRRGSLSDYSSYESSDEETHGQRGSSSRTPYRQTGWDTGSRSASKARAYAGLPEESEDNLPKSAGKKKAVEEDPFADPFAD